MVPRSFGSRLLVLLSLSLTLSATCLLTTGGKVHKGGLSSGSPCNASPLASEAVCEKTLSCTCLALQRGLHVCMQPNMLSPPPWALKWERQGLSCSPKLPKGLEVMLRPPSVSFGLEVVDPRRVEDAKLRDWALGPGRGFYSRYAVVKPRGQSLGAVGAGVPVLAGDDVSKKTVNRFAAAAQHFLVDVAMDNATFLSLAKSGVRVLVANKRNGGWKRHPEVKRHFSTEMGGGAPWYPSTGIMSNEPSNLLVEELLHTMQYTAMRPRMVCMYHKAYSAAVASKLYTTDESGPEIDAEPVPTVQADEYLAMALQRWLGSNTVLKEYRVRGNSKKVGGRTGRENLKKRDPSGFCLISTLFRSDDTWNPSSTAKPWVINPNRGMDIGEVARFCKPVLAMLEVGCPTSDLSWPEYL